MSMSTFLSRHDNISNEMSLLLDRISTPGLEAARSTSLLKQMSTSCLTQLTKETSNGQVERGYFVADDTPKDFEYSQKRRSRTRSSNGLSSPVAKYEFSKRQKCLSWCNCACHIKGNFSSPRTLSALFGELRVQYNGRSRLPCNCSPSSSFSVSYRFPQYLLLRYVLLVVYLNQIAGPEYLLRVPRVLPPSHRLWHYSINGDIMAVQNMYSQGLASPYDVNMKNGPAIFYAVEQETPEFAHFLLDQGVDFDIPNTAGLTAGELLWDRAFGGRYGDEGSAVVQRLLQGDEGIYDTGFTTLHKIVLGFIYKDLRAVLEASTGSINAVDSRGRTPLHWAVLRDDQAAVQDLLGNSADPNITDREGFVAVDFVRSASVCRSLLKANANINNPAPFNNRCALQHAVNRNAPVEVIEILTAAGSDINLRDADRETALLNAIYWGYTEIVERLIQLGANVNAANISSRDSSIHFSAAFDRSELLPLLLGRGADYTALNIYGHDLGHTAAIFAGAEFFNVMSRYDLHRLSLDVPDKEGKTAKDHMNLRMILTDREIGVHRAFKSLVVSLSAPWESKEGNLDILNQFEVDHQTRTPDFPQIPGAFPQQ